MSYQSGTPRDPNQLAQIISSNIQKITQQTSGIQRIVNQLGTPQDTTELRQQLQQKQLSVNQLAKETDRFMKEFGSLPVTTEQRQRKIQKDRLVNDFSNTLAIFQKIQRQAAQKEKEFVARVRASSRVSGGFPDDGFKGGNVLPSESEPPSYVQTQADAITEEDLMLIKERETTIRQLESDILDINEIFKDLGMMIHEQGDTIAQVTKEDMYSCCGSRNTCCGDWINHLGIFEKVKIFNYNLTLYGQVSQTQIGTSYALPNVILATVVLD
ncbi:syntaxin-7 isoform X1 [Amia ocellicauda]|uniref:syntaxin-7 isoform X1 n=1 Tax=Amia ocellicauda TaxID=2972642 RepID=UPI003464D630